MEYKANVDRVALEPGKFTEVGPDKYEATEAGGRVDIWHDYPTPEGAPPSNKQEHDLQPGDTIEIIDHGHGFTVKIKHA